MNEFYVIQIGLYFYRTFTGKYLNNGEIFTSGLFESKRFLNKNAAETAANLIVSNESVKNPVSVKTCGIIGGDV